MSLSFCTCFARGGAGLDLDGHVSSLSVATDERIAVAGDASKRARRSLLQLGLQPGLQPLRKQKHSGSAATITPSKR